MVRERTYCIECQSFVEGDPNGECTEYHWKIRMEVARLDKVCYYDSFKDRFIGEIPGFVEVVTPLKHIALLSMEGYEKGKVEKKEKLNFWRFKNILI